jgi:hypothetical protein
MSMSLGNEILRRLVNDMTVHHLEEMEDVDLQRLTDQLWRWHDKALSELLKRGHVVPQQKRSAADVAEAERIEGQEHR